MSYSRIFQQAGKQLYSGIFLRWNPLIPIGGRSLVSGLSKNQILNTIDFKSHIEKSGEGLASLTPSLPKATRWAKHGGYDANDPEAFHSYNTPSVVATVDTTTLDLRHIKDVLHDTKHYIRRMNEEIESVSVIVLPTIVKGWYINEKYVENPFYLSQQEMKNNPLVEQLEATYIEIMKIKADVEFNEKNPEAIKAVDKYHSILCDIAGGPKAFVKKLEKLNADIIATGYEMDPNSKKIFNSALCSQIIASKPYFK